MDEMKSSGAQTVSLAQGTRQAKRAWAAARRNHIKRGRVVITEIQHDDWCPIYTTERFCACDPIRVLKDSEGRILAHVEGAGSDCPIAQVSFFSRGGAND